MTYQNLKNNKTSHDNTRKDVYIGRRVHVLKETYISILILTSPNFICIQVEMIYYGLLKSFNNMVKDETVVTLSRTIRCNGWDYNSLNIKN